MASSRRFWAFVAFALFLISLSGLFTARRGLHGSVRGHLASYTSLQQHEGSAKEPLNRKIWQTHKNSSETLFDKNLRKNVISWHKMNSHGWQYEMLNDERIDRYVTRRFKEQPELVRLFTGLKNPYMRVDLFRYLVLLGDGGVYTDMDTECLTPIDNWIPEDYKNTTDVVVGVQYDAPGQDKGEAALQLQLTNWTILARKGHGLFKLVVKRAVEAIEELMRIQDASLQTLNATFDNVLMSTGPARFTLSVWEYLSEELGEEFDGREASGLTGPKFVNGILFMPATSFGRSKLQSNDKPKQDLQQLVYHHSQEL